MRTTCVLVAILALAAPAVAQQTFVWFYGAGSANLLESPVVYSGQMMGGGDIETGSWEIRLADDGWPSDERERLPFLWETFFAGNYVRALPFGIGGPGWVADLTRPAPTSTADSHAESWLPLWIHDDTNGGSMFGWCHLLECVQDDNLNGLLDEDEFSHGFIVIDEIIICYGEGPYDSQGGPGNSFGEFTRVGTGHEQGIETWIFGMYLWLEDCWNPCDPPDYRAGTTGELEGSASTWGTIKAMYR